MPRSDRTCMIGTRDRPFYSFTYGRAYIHFVEALVGVVTGVAGFLVVLGASMVLDAGTFTMVLVVMLGASLITGCVVTRLIFFVPRRVMLAGGATCAVVAGLTITGLLLVFSLVERVPAWSPLVGGALVGAVLVSLVLLHRIHGKIGLFTDGIQVGPRAFHYDDIIDVGHGTGRDMESKIPPAGTGKPVVVLTPIEYEHVEKDFGIFHVYLVLVTRDEVFVAQSITRQSNLAQDTRNAWSRRVHGHE